MSDRYVDAVALLRRRVSSGPGQTAPALRAAVEARAAALGGHGHDAEPVAREVPASMRALVDTIARHAYRVTDRDIDALREAGCSEDEIFEIIASAAVGAGIGRLERGLAALRGDV